MNYEKFYLIGFGISTLYAFVMLPYNLERMQRVDTIEEKTTTNTELLETKEDGRKDLSETLQTIGILIPSANAQTNESVKNVKISTTSHIECDQKCKNKVLIDAGINKNLAKEIINVCKELTKDPVHCIKYASSVSSAESGGGKSCYKNNCFGIKAGTIGFKTLNEGVIDWVTRYNKYWYKATSMSQFYAPKGKLPYFRYCTSENSSNSLKGCPNGLKHSSSTFNKITF